MRRAGFGTATKQEHFVTQGKFFCKKFDIFEICENERSKMKYAQAFNRLQTLEKTLENTTDVIERALIVAQINILETEVERQLSEAAMLKDALRGLRTLSFHHNNLLLN